MSLPDEICDAYWNVLNKCFNEYIEKYDLDTLTLSSHNFKIHKVKPGGGYHTWHYENSAWQFRDRFMAYMTYLKVPESGGETEFLHQSIRIKPEVGTTLLWPPGFTHKHRGNPPLKGNKYILTTWLEYYE